MLLLVASTAQAVETTTLDNGLRVALEVDSRQPWVSVVLCYDAGTRDEQPGELEYAHLFEHLMFGKSERAPHAFSEEMRQIGGTENAFTYADRTCYESGVPAADLRRILWFEADRMNALAGALTQEAIDEQKAVVKAEILQRSVDNPVGRALDLLRHNLFPAHAYSHATPDRLKDLEAATLERLQAWHRARYVPSRAWLAVVGDFELEETREWIDSTLGALPDTPPAPRVRPSRRALIQSRVSQVPRGEERRDTIFIGWQSARAGTDQDRALEHGAAVLMHWQAELIADLRDVDGFLGMQVWQQGFDHAGMFVVMLALEPLGDHKRAVQRVLTEVERLGEEREAAMYLGPIRRAKTYERESTRGDTLERAKTLLRTWWYTGVAGDETDETVTPDMIVAAAGHWLVPARAAVVGVIDQPLPDRLDGVFP